MFNCAFQDAPVITRLVPGGAFTQIVPSEARLVGQAPLVTRVLSSAPAILPAAAPAVLPAPVPVARIVQAAPAVRIADDAESFDPNPQYNFGYSVSDAITGDAKTREEARNGDVVTG
jgi:hypothetical protein